MHAKFWSEYLKRPLGRLMCRREDNIRVDRMEVVWEDVYWIQLAQDSD